jgi:hypothetical protein
MGGVRTLALGERLAHEREWAIQATREHDAASVNLLAIVGGGM